jgi:hypothetical protein
VEHLERRLVTSEAELPLELQGAHAWCLCRNEVSRPEPDREWLSRAVHDGPGSETYLVAAVTTFEHAGAGPKTPRITNKITGRAFEAFRPPDPFQVAGAGRFIGEQLLELQQGLGQI